MEISLKYLGEFVKKKVTLPSHDNKILAIGDLHFKKNAISIQTKVGYSTRKLKSKISEIKMSLILMFIKMFYSLTFFF